MFFLAKTKSKGDRRTREKPELYLRYRIERVNGEISDPLCDSVNRGLALVILERIAIRENELCKSRERIAIRENELCKSRERIVIRANELFKAEDYSYYKRQSSLLRFIALRGARAHKN